MQGCVYIGGCVNIAGALDVADAPCGVNIADAPSVAGMLTGYVGMDAYEIGLIFIGL